MYNNQIVKNLVFDFCTKHKKETQETIAKQMGIAVGTMFGKNPSAENIEKIADYLDVDINVLFNRCVIDNKINIVNEPPVKYGKKQNTEELYKILFEQQKEITELIKEVERLKNK